MTRLDVVVNKILLLGWFIESKSIKFEGTSGHFAVKSLRVWVTPINHPSHPEQEEAFASLACSKENARWLMIV